MAFLPVQSNQFVVRTVSSLPATGRQGQTVLDSGDGNYYVWLNGQWNLITIVAPAFTNDTGVPIGLLIGLTYP